MVSKEEFDFDGMELDKAVATKAILMYDLEVDLLKLYVVETLWARPLE